MHTGNIILASKPKKTTTKKRGGGELMRVVQVYVTCRYRQQLYVLTVEVSQNMTK